MSNNTKLAGECYTSVISDVMRDMGLQDYLLPSQIQPVQPNQKLYGPVWTVEGKPDPSADPHETLLAWTGLLSEAKPEHVWVCQPNTREIALMGELSAETLHKKGVRGCVIDGALRDADFILNLGFDCWRTHHTPRDIVGAWLPVATEVEITIGNTKIAPGDWVHGDRDGMLRIPQKHVDEVIRTASEAMQTENKIRAAILSGTDPKDAYLEFGKF